MDAAIEEADGGERSQCVGNFASSKYPCDSALSDETTAMMPPSVPLAMRLPSPGPPLRACRPSKHNNQLGADRAISLALSRSRQGLPTTSEATSLALSR